MASDTQLEGSVSVRETGTLVSSLKTIMWILLCVFVCYIFFSLSYLPFRIDLEKADPLASWFLSLFFFPNQELLAMLCGYHSCKASPALATSTSLSARNYVIVCVHFVTSNHGGKW